MFPSAEIKFAACDRDDDFTAVLAAVRDVVLRYLPDGYREGINYGMISYEIPLEEYPNTYNHQPLSYLGLAAQKNHFALYLTCVSADGRTRSAASTTFTSQTPRRASSRR